MSDIVFYNYLRNENLPIDKQSIDDIEEDDEPDNGDEKFHDDDERQDNPN